VRRQLRSAPFHKVLLVPDYNAAVVQIPRLGVFGWQQNYLLIGLPLMLGLDTQEFKSVLAHEFGHLSRNHARFTGWIYRVRRAWEQLFQLMFQRRQRDLGLLRPFLRWFWPKFNASAFVLSRQNEYVADRCAAELAGARHAASALMRVRVHRPLVLEKFWPDLFARAKDEAVPPANPYPDMAARFVAAGDPAETARWLKASLLEPTSTADTHPCLRERLEAMGQLPAALAEGQFPAELPPHAGTSAAGDLLGDQFTNVAAQMGQQWAMAIKEGWARRHQEVQAIKQQLAKVEAETNGELTVDDLWTRTELRARLDGDKGALPMVTEILRREPNHAGANFVQGRYALAQGDEGGVEFMERALRSDPALTLDGLNVLHHFYRQTGDAEKLRELEARHVKQQGIVAKARAERADISPVDTFLPHELKPAELAALQQLLSAEPEIERACLARKQVEFLPTHRMYVLRLGIKKSGAVANRTIVQKVVKTIKLPGQVYVFVPEGNLKLLGQHVLAVTGSVILDRAT
jgi:hypothetical protein